MGARKGAGGTPTLSDGVAERRENYVGHAGEKGITQGHKKYLSNGKVSEIAGVTTPEVIDACNAGVLKPAGLSPHARGILI